MGKNVSALDLLSRGQRSASARATPVSGEVVQETIPGTRGEPANKSTSTPVEGSGSGPAGAGAGPARVTYVRSTVSLTPEQQRWVRSTTRALDTDGLSGSDLVRLALARLREDVDGGLPLLDLLVDQAHAEAEHHTGRRNRGLPTRR